MVHFLEDFYFVDELERVSDGGFLDLLNGSNLVSVLGFSYIDSSICTFAQLLKYSINYLANEIIFCDFGVLA